ncbi:SDR family oxidoreductase [Candidatus Uabimicrobium sp. HlEnr_7]|uniref:SDR family oxidoreductase n=1 Tax=Candidatus Uabimicrobium helgolandensis TaxID=3095367 RepID=UPI0035577181
MERKSIFITGAASGIGKETALFFAERDWFVGLFDVNENGLVELAEKIGEEQCCYKVVDVSDFQEMEQAVAFFGEKTNNQMNVLFNNAGVMHMDFFENIPHESHVKAVQVNIMGVVNGVYACLDILKNTPKAHIVSMCSASAFYGTPEVATYSATKFFVRGFTEALNIELEKKGITVTDLMPLFVNTHMIKSQDHQCNSLKKFGAQLSPQQIAKIVWKAAHKKKVHWVPTLQLKFLSYMGNAFPFMGKTLMKIFS